MKYHALTFVCLLAAVGSYVVGLGAGVLVFVAAGMGLELVFWYRLFQGSRRNQRS